MTIALNDEPTDIEVAGMTTAGDAGGLYLDEIGKDCLSDLEYDEWMGFIETIIRAYEKKCLELYGDPPVDPPM